MFTMVNGYELWLSFKTVFNLKICMDSKIRRSIALYVEPIMEKSSFIYFAVHDVHLSTLGPPHVLYTRESLSMLEGVSELVLFFLFLLILWLGLTLSRVGSQSL